MNPESRLQGVFQCIHDLLLRDGVMAASQVHIHHHTDICIRQSIALAQQCMHCRPAVQFVPSLTPSSAVCLASPPCSQLPKHSPLGDGALVCRLQVHTPPALPSRAMLDLVSTLTQCNVLQQWGSGCMPPTLLGRCSVP